MPSIASLTDAIKESIKIDAFIYHIIRQDADIPDYNDEVILSDEQRIFFEDQIKTACDGTQFCFYDKDNNTTFQECKTLLEDIGSNLNPISRSLANRFYSAHNKSMSEGVFIVAVISILHNNVRKKLLSFLKVDYSIVYQQQITQVRGKKQATLTRVMDSLANSPRALQKWAIVDPGDLFAWDTIALQRGKSSAQKDTEVAISRYFRTFLQVHVRENAAALTKNSVAEAIRWARNLDDLPEEVSRSDFKSRAISYFENSENFDTERFIDQVLGNYIKPDMDEPKREEMTVLRNTHKESFREALAQAGIAGQVFESKPDSIPPGDKRTMFSTLTGVKVSFQGTLEDNGIDVQKVGDEYIVVIKTPQLDGY